MIAFIENGISYLSIYLPLFRNPFWSNKKNDSILLFDGAEYIHGIVSPHHLVELVVATVHGAHTKKWEAELNGSGELMVGGRVSEVKT